MAGLSAMLVRIAKYTGCLLLLVLLAATFTDVVARNVFNSPIKGGSEFVGLVQVALICLAFPLIAAREEHIVVDIFDRMLGKGVARAQGVLAGLLGSLVFGLLAWQSAVIGLRVFAYGDNSGYLQFPTAYVFWFISAASVVTVIAFLLVVLRKLFPGNGDRSPLPEEAL